MKPRCTSLSSPSSVAVCVSVTIKQAREMLAMKNRWNKTSAVERGKLEHLCLAAASLHVDPAVKSKLTEGQVQLIQAGQTTAHVYRICTHSCGLASTRLLVYFWNRTSSTPTSITNIKYASSLDLRGRVELRSVSLMGSKWNIYHKPQFTHSSVLHPQHARQQTWFSLYFRRQMEPFLASIQCREINLLLSSVCFIISSFYAFQHTSTTNAEFCMFTDYNITF